MYEIKATRSIKVSNIMPHQQDPQYENGHDP